MIVTAANGGGPLHRTRPDRYCGDSASSALAKSFGAEVSVPRATPGSVSLFLVVGRDASPAAAVAGVGGRVLERLPDARKVIALMTHDAHARLQAAPEIRLVGAVAVDQERFSTFARLVALDQPP